MGFRPTKGLLLAVLIMLTGCASRPDVQPEGIVLSDGQAPVAWADPGEHIMQLEPGDYLLTFGNGSTDAKDIGLYVRNDHDQPHHARYQFSITNEGYYRLHQVSGTDPHFRIVKAKAPEPAQMTATAPGRPTNEPALCQASYKPLTITVGDVFKDGETLRDTLSGRTATVSGGKVTVTPAAGSEGLVLLEADQWQGGKFSWSNATVYFAITDRFANGRTDNDQSYGRKPDGKEEIGTFHGGDFAGLTEKLDYLDELGINALWISPPFEQMHGWVGGGDRGDFQHYGYHGYYTQDFTRLDNNMGTPEELKTLISEAHKRGIRVLFDVVMNHPAYATLQDMQTFNFGGLRDGFEQYLPERWGNWEPEGYEDYHDYHAMIDYDHSGWSRWWGKDWVRAGIADYNKPPSVTANPQQGSLAFLPDFRTESSQSVSLPTFLANKPDTGARELPDATVRDYLITWLTEWVREYGIDGFRVDTAKHVEAAAWAELKQAAQKAWEAHYQAHPEKQKLTDRFWMVGEVFPHGVDKTLYFDNGFDAVINFDFQKREAKKGAQCLSNLDATYAEYARKLNSDPDFNVMSYISSHDTTLFSRLASGPEMQKRVAPALLLLPGAVQLFYGDETGRAFGPSGSDPMQGTRSDMNWADLETEDTQQLHQFWQQVAQFRNRHPAVGAGEHRKLSDQPYAFSRTKGKDRVVIAVGEKAH